MDSTKNEIYQYIKQISSKFSKDNAFMFSTQDICDKLRLSRNLTSQYLNQLQRENKLIKINSRPVYFIDPIALNNAYNTTITHADYLSIDELIDELEIAKVNNANFNKLIGKKESLSYCIDQAIVAISYPDNGLPIFIVGESGTGKTYFAKVTAEYIIQNKFANSSVKYFECFKYRNNQNLFINNLSRALEQTNEKNILIFDDIHFLSGESFEFIISLLEQTYEHNKSNKNNKFLIITSSSSLDMTNRQKLSSKLPITIQIPSLQERQILEITNLIHLFYKTESDKIDKNILVSSKVLNTLLNYKFTDNISGLRNAIQLSVANSLAKQKNKENHNLNIYMHDLHDYITYDSNSQDVNNYFIDNSMVEISTITQITKSNKTCDFLENIIKTYDQFDQSEITYNELLSSLIKHINEYYELIQLDKNYISKKMKSIEKTISSIFNEIEELYRIYFPSSFAYALSNIIANRLQITSFINNFEEENHEIIDNLHSIITENFPKETIISDEIENMISQELDLHIGKLELVTIILSIHIFNHNIYNTETLGIIIAHGYSTASSVADITNTLLGYRLFEAVDMPYNVSMTEVADKIKKIMHIKRNIKNLIMLVDMGSLEHLGDELEDLSNVNIGIINNISTGLAINIGYKILSNFSIDLILKKACDEYTIKYKIITKEKKQRAIIFTSENGDIINKKLADLFKKSLPKKTGIHIIPYNFQSLINKDEQKLIFDSYEVLFICGTLNPNIQHIPFISIDSFLNISEISKISNSLYSYLNKTELEVFQKNLLFNFSMQNIVGYLSILDAKKIIDTVNRSLFTLQNLLQIKIDFNTSIGLMIHISCMIERLVTHSSIYEEVDISSFAKKEIDTIHIIKESLKDIELNYGISIPTYELLYIYDYIKSFLH